MALLIWRMAAEWRTHGDILRDQLRLDPAPLALAWLLQTAGWLLVVEVWRRILSHLGGQLGYARHLRLYAWTALAHVIPGSIWAPAGRLAFYRQEGLRARDVGAAIVVEWLLLGLAGFLLYALSAPFTQAFPARLVALLAAAALGAVLLLHPRVFHGALRGAARLLGRDGVPEGGAFRARDLGLWLLAELVVLALSGVALYLLMLALAPKASLAEAMAAWAMSVALANLLAWLPFTSLIKDGGMVLMLTPLYGSVLLATAVVVAWRLWMALVELSWAGLGSLAAARAGPSEASLPPRDQDDGEP